MTREKWFVALVLAASICIALFFAPVFANRTQVVRQSESELPETTPQKRLDIYSMIQEDVERFDAGLDELMRSLPVASAAPGTDEWMKSREEAQEFNALSLWTLCFHQGSHIGHSAFAHNKYLNPDKRPIVDGEMQQMRLLVDYYRQHMNKIVKAQARVEFDELEQLRERGYLEDNDADTPELRARLEAYMDKRYKAYGGSASRESIKQRLDDAGGVPVTRLGYITYIHQGESYRYPLEKLSMRKFAVEYRKLRALEYAHAMIAWFTSHGYLTRRQKEAEEEKLRRFW